MTGTPLFVWQGSKDRATALAQDASVAAGHVRREALAGDAGAQLTLGLMLLDGHGVPRDTGAAFRWFQIAARSGNRDAINLMGRCHELGWGTSVNLALAAQCYRAAAEAKHDWAQFNLACLILREDGIPGDVSEALALLARSARGGNAKAMNLLGRCCEEGWRGRPKPASARRWYLRAARGGCFRGAFHTARHLIAAGDVDRAVTWLHRSIALAPADFCAELGARFHAHPDARLCAVSTLAYAQSQRAPRHAPSDGQLSMRKTAKPVASLESGRGPYAVASAVKRLAGMARVLRS